jgi:hypothetical protein
MNTPSSLFYFDGSGGDITLDTLTFENIDCTGSDGAVLKSLFTNSDFELRLTAVVVRNCKTVGPSYKAGMSCEYYC